jgi:protein-L-isoaspartate(D-aspartate) O-methyltransferase
MPKDAPTRQAGAPVPARSPVSNGIRNGFATTGPAVLSPQAHLQMAQRDAQAPTRTGSPSPVPTPSIPTLPVLAGSDVRARLVERLRSREGIADEQVLRALRQVERHRFVDPALAAQAYEDTSLPIGHGQTISKPSVVARMIELLLQGATAQVRHSLGRTLEIGTGCGYQAAVLCRLASDVFSIERLRALHDLARANLEGQRPRNLRLIYGDGMLGHAPNAPYQSIIAAAGGDHVPEAWLDQLAIGGRLVAPVSTTTGGSQSLLVMDRTETGYRRSSFDAVHFVPLKSGSA